MRALLLSLLCSASLALAKDPTSAPTSEPTPRVIVGSSHIEVTVLGPMLFEENSATLTEGTASALALVAKVMEDMPQITLIEIAGYADPSTEKKDAKALSLRRAKEAKAYLVSKGVSAKRISAKGYGVTSPASKTEPAANRRIDVQIKKTK